MRPAGRPTIRDSLKHKFVAILSDLSDTRYEWRRHCDMKSGYTCLYGVNSELCHTFHFFFFRFFPAVCDIIYALIYSIIHVWNNYVVHAPIIQDTYIQRTHTHTHAHFKGENVAHRRKQRRRQQKAPWLNIKDALAKAHNYVVLAACTKETAIIFLINYLLQTNTYTHRRTLLSCVLYT